MERGEDSGVRTGLEVVALLILEKWGARGRWSPRTQTQAGRFTLPVTFAVCNKVQNPDAAFILHTHSSLSLSRECDSTVCRAARNPAKTKSKGTSHGNYLMTNWSPVHTRHAIIQRLITNLNLISKAVTAGTAIARP